MPIPDPLPHHDELLLRHLRAFFGPLDDAALALIRERLRWVQLHAGDTLMRQGDPGDALYLLVSGRLRVYIEEEGRPRAVREIPRGEVVGEMSLYTDAPRTATLVAIRESVLVSLAKDDFLRVQAASPQFTTAMTRKIVERLQTERLRDNGDRPVTMAVLPVSAGIDAAAFAREFAGALAVHGRVARLDAATIETRLRARQLSLAAPDERVGRAVHDIIDAVEASHDHVLLVADPMPGPWTELCTRHADEILLVADAAAQPMPHPIEQAYLLDRQTRPEAAEILVLLHPPGAWPPRRTAAWLARRPVADHVHLRRDHAADMAHLARVQARRAVGLVLAGGGARGFAHLGVYRALVEQGVEIDMVGGTSIGAVMAALIATGLPYERIEQVARHAFDQNPTGDWSLMPLLALIKGRRLRRVIAEAAGTTMGEGAGLEDFPRRLFCIASNYSRACEVVFDRGPLVPALMASTAIPGALPPELLDGELLCDGGTFNNFPVDVMRLRRGIGTVIGVDLSNTKRRRVELEALPGGWQLFVDGLKPKRARRYRLPRLSSILVNSTTLYSASRQQDSRALTDLYFNPPLDRVGMLDWKRFDAIVAQGYAHAREVLGQRAEPAPDTSAPGVAGRPAPAA